MPSMTDAKSRQVLSETPARALIFISAVSTTSSIRETLETRGYDAETHAAYWQILLRFAGYQEGPSAPSLDERARQAAQEITLWQEPNFRIARAALKHDHADAHDFIFPSIDASRGVGPLVAVVTFLDKLDALEQSPDRKKTRKGDHAALAKLAGRGITREERDRLRRLLALAMRAPGLGPETDTARGEGVEAVPKDERQTTLIQLHGIYEEWAEVARVVIHRRADLIKLGLIKRRRMIKTGRAPAAAAGAIVVTQVATPPATPPAATPATVGLLPAASVAHANGSAGSPPATDTPVAPAVSAPVAAPIDAAPPTPAAPVPASPLDDVSTTPAPFSQGIPEGLPA